MSEITTVSILGEPSIVVGSHLWGEYIVQDLLKHVPSSLYVLITDTNLYSNYVPSFEDAFQRSASRGENPAKLHTFQIPPGETSKSRSTKARIEDWMLSSARDPPCDTGCVIIALGGGVIGDMVGFVAATFKRGVRFVQVPTTLLAMVDSSIGGKTAIDTPAGKNLIGSFWQPKRIYIDIGFLNTLPRREFINGMAEVVKTAAIWSETDFAYLEANSPHLMSIIEAEGDVRRERLTAFRAQLKEVVLASVRVKAEVVTLDEREGGLRNLLNFGHSIGHAYEGILTPQILHGECVAFGMVLEAKLSRHLGILNAAGLARLTKCIKSYGLPISPGDELVQQRSGGKVCRTDDLMSILSVDKKNLGKMKRIVLLRSIGLTHDRKATAVSDAHIRFILSPALMVPAIKCPPTTFQCLPPGSKSISNRALVLAALGEGSCRIHNLLHSDDTEVMINALKEMNGAVFTWEQDGAVLRVDGRGGNLTASGKSLYLGNAGTAARFLTTVSCLAHVGHAASVELTGNKRMTERPIGPLVESLNANGAEIEYLGTRGALPLRIQCTGGLRGGHVKLAATLSSQYVSSILMAAPYSSSPTALELVGGEPVSQSYIDLTCAMMAEFGIHVERSRENRNLYSIPSMKYQNPPDYYVECDASSATYPLAIAAITGTTCEIPNLGSSSLQGDANFATQVLRRMGCEVQQTVNATKVTGPPKGQLQPLGTIDMESMTDAFMTATVLAAVAHSKTDESSVTRITGIANQRVKECDRIAAMRTELGRFGVKCIEHEDGLEIHGKSAGDFLQNEHGVHCYDDHRIAMSFSVLSAGLNLPVLIRERECVAKTWPNWWASFGDIVKSELSGQDVLSEAKHLHGGETSVGSKSVLFIGMRGAGKTTYGQMAASMLGWSFLDLDVILEARNNTSIPAIISSHGWPHFRHLETTLLGQILEEFPINHIIACGGGIVESETARDILRQYCRTGGKVVHIERDFSDVETYLKSDTTRPPFQEALETIWLRREPWYRDCSNEQHFVHNNAQGTSATELQNLVLRLDRHASVLDSIKAKPFSSFLSLTCTNVREILDVLENVLSGTDAVELRVDLLHACRIADVEERQAQIQKQFELLRSSTALPIIYTVRTQHQGGAFSNQDIEGLVRLCQLGFRLKADFVDIEMHLSNHEIASLLRHRSRSTKVIASHHDVYRQLSWSDGSWIPHFNKAVMFGDIVKLVGSANSINDNMDLYEFRRQITIGLRKPLIAINMGIKGQLSRLMNTFFTPVTHELLGQKAAPGQLSAAEIRRGLALHGMIPSKRFFLFGQPIQHSRSPAMHNALFENAGLPYQYSLLETSSADDLKDIVHADDFGGASVTIPLKIDALGLVERVTADAEAIGAINTIVVHESEGRRSLEGHNTDWQGILRVLQNAAKKIVMNRPAVILGAGGTSRAAVFALHKFGCAPIVLLARDVNKAENLARSFPRTMNVQALSSNDMAAFVDQKIRPSVVVGTVPADQPLDSELKARIESIFRATSQTEKESRPIYLEMAYQPKVTSLMQMAQEHFWQTLAGLEVLLAQGLVQFELWTRSVPARQVAASVVLN